MTSPLPYELDHVIVMVNDLATAEPVARRMGIGITSRSEHPGFGTRNARAAFETGYLEPLARVDQEVLRRSRYGRVLDDRLGGNEGAPIVFVLKTPDIDAVVRLCHERGGRCEDRM